MTRMNQENDQYSSKQIFGIEIIKVNKFLTRRLVGEDLLESFTF